MPTLRPLDNLIVDVVVDNQSDNYSSKPEYVSGEFNNVIAAGAAEISGLTLCCAQLGLALVLTAEADGKRHKVLFDAGPEGAIFVRNAKTLGVRLDDVDEVGISHGHWDHMGALVEALDEITSAGKRKVPVHVNPGMFLERGARLTTGAVVPFQKVPSVEQLTAHGGTVVNDANERLLCEDFFYLSGEIPRVTSFEKGRTDHLGRKGESDDWTPDPLLMDERFLAANIKGKGLIVFSSCSHAGILNVMHHVTERFPDVPLYGVFGGFHLVGSLEKIIPDTVDSMRKFAPKLIVPGHCTGWRAVCAMVNAFGEDVVVPSAVGSKYNL